MNTDKDGSHPYDRLTPDVLLTALEHAGFRTNGHLLALNSFENRVYQVGLDEAEPVVVKFYRPNRWTAEQILEEHTFSRFLQGNDLPVVAPLANEGGQTLFAHSDFLFAVFPRQGGRAPELGNEDHLRVLGRTLARWHAAGNDRPYQVRPVLDIVEDSRQALDFVSTDVVDINVAGRYRELGAAILNRMETLVSDVPLEPLNVHGDCHVGNILWRDQHPHFVDLDDSLRAPAMQDLWMLLSGSKEENRRQLIILAEGYEAFLPFPWHQRRLIEPLRTRRILRHSAWLARRWNDPAFPKAFPWFDSIRYWQDHIGDLTQQLTALDKELQD